MLTIRIVFWVNEEKGGAGRRAYREWVGYKIGDKVAEIEMDGGAQKPLRDWLWRIRCPSKAISSVFGSCCSAFGMLSGFDESSLSAEEKQSFVYMKDIASLLGSIGADTVSPGGGGSDNGPIVADGVPALSPRTVGEHHSDWHHTEADGRWIRLIRIRSMKNTAMLSVDPYVLADMDGRFAGRKGWSASNLSGWKKRLFRVVFGVIAF